MEERNAAVRQIRSLPQRYTLREDDKNAYIEGYFSVFNTPYVLWEGAEEIILPGAFDGCMGQDTRALVNHDTTLVLGRTKNGTLELKQDDHGLWGRITINKADTDAVNLYARVDRGDVDQCSFGFTIESERYVDLGGGKCRWEIEKIGQLFEVSVCTFPAYEATSVSAREADLKEINRRKLESRRAEIMKKLKGEI